MSIYYIIKNLVLLCLFSTFFVGVESQVLDPLCPYLVKGIIERINGGGSCEGIKCQTGLNREKCTAAGGVLEEGIAFCGCCPGCAKYEHVYGESCDATSSENGFYDTNCNDLICSIIFQCPRGLECRASDPNNPTLTTCGESIPLPPPPPRATVSPCPNFCFLKKAIIEQENKIFNPNRHRDPPSCTPEEGTFARKQCKGEDCFCVNECGDRIFGRELKGRDGNMTCGCSAKMHELRGKGLYATLHCKENGDFEKLQCDSESGLCYCVDEITGKTTGEVLPEMHFKLLPCYNTTVEEFAEDGHYLRVCESEWVAGQKMERETLLHGASYRPRIINCDYDGGFAPMLRDSEAGQDKCVHRSGIQISPYFRTSDLNPSNAMDCQCVRDRIYKARQGVSFTIDCEAESRYPPPGSHKLYHTNDQFAYCVDIDGHQFGPDVPLASVCCLETPIQGGNHHCENPGPDVLCDPNPTRPYPYKPCLEYKMGRTNYH